MKVILSAAAIAFCLSSISAHSQAAPSTPAHDPGHAETNKTSAPSQLQRVRRRLSERNVDLLILLQQNASKLNSPEYIQGASTFTVKDGLYQLVAAPEAPGAVQFSASGIDDADSNPTSRRTHINFSYPSTFKPASEASASLAGADSPEAASMMAPLESNPAGVPASEGVLAWSDGVSKTSASLDGSLPADADLRSTAKPNIIIPEPKEWVLFAIFGGAILTFSSRRGPAKPAA